MFLGVVEPCKGSVGGEGGGSCLSSLTRTALLNQFYKMLSRGPKLDESEKDAVSNFDSLLSLHPVPDWF